MHAAIQHEKSTVARTARVAVYVACAVIVCGWSIAQRAEAMIPWFVEDWRWDTRTQPFAMSMILQNAVIYCENDTDGDGDAVYFDTAGGPELVRYVGFRNIPYGWLGSELDPDHLVMSTETNFYHTVDPATITAWRRTDGVEIHWTPDMRFVPSTEYSALPNPPSAVQRYRIDRYVDGSAEPDLQQEVQGVDSWVDFGADSGTTYAYKLVSWNAGTGQYVAYSAEPVVVDPAVVDRPHFWGYKDAFQETYYEESDGPTGPAIAVDFPVRISADRSISTANATIEIYRGASASPLLVTGFAYDPITYTLTAVVPTSTSDFLAHGGLAYRLVYDDPVSGQEIYYPPQQPGAARYVNSTINNRLMQVGFYYYEARIEGDEGTTPTYWSAFLGLMERLRDGVDFGTGVTTFDGVYMDCVGVGFGALQNPPYEYAGEQQFRLSTANAIQYLCANNPGFKHYANTNDLPLIELLDGTAGLVGTYDEKWPNQGDLSGASWEQHCLEALWKARAHPGLDLILEDARNYETDLEDREQQLAAYLFVRQPDAAVAAEHLLLGYGTWKPVTAAHYPNEVVILPEQMFNFGDAISDPFDITWPDAATILSASSTVDGAIDWLEANTEGFIRELSSGLGKFAVREYYVDGGGGQQYEVYAVADFSGSGGVSTMVTLRDIFPEKAATTFYRIQLQGTPPLVSLGARLWTEPVVFDDPWPSMPGNVAVFFSQPVSSPVVAETAEHAIPIDSGEPAVLEIAVSHWNGQPLADVRADCSVLGWESNIELEDPDHDGVYTCERGAPTSGVGTFSVDVVAVGTDGLLTRAAVSVEVNMLPTTYLDRSRRPDGTSRMPYQALPYSSVTVDFDGQGPRDMVVSLLNDRAQLYAATQMTDDGGIPAYYPTADAFATGSYPDNLLGMAVADINSDGYEELFGASQEAPRLYELQGAAYADRAAAWGVSTAALLSTTGAWADYDCDGDVDLVIGTADCGAFEPGGYNIGPAVADVLLRNDLNTSGTFSNVSVAAGLQPDYYSNTTTVTWGDINDDGFPDLFVGEYGEPVSGPPHGIDCRLFVNQRDGTFVDEADSLIGTHQAVFTIASAWRDMDNDGDLDIELANRTNRESLRYDVGTGLVSIAISDDDGQYSGLRVFDHDLDGLDDILLLPSQADGVPRLLTGVGDSGGMSYVNVARAVGLEIPGKVGGAIAADLNGDGDADLFLGREPEKDSFGAYLEGDQYLFQAKSSGGAIDAPENNWFSVRLQSSSLMNNRMGIGAKVTVNEVGRTRVRLVDGGSGRGGQDAPTMIFGLGSATSVESVTVDWPNGYHQVVPGTSLNISTGPGISGANVIEDASVFSSPMCAVSGRFEVVPQSQLIDWIFTWTTDLKTSPDLDEIVFDTTGMSWECQDGLVPLNRETPDVEITATILADGRMQHQLIWRNRPCAAGCTLKFRAHSWINTNEGTSSLGQRLVKFCLSN